MRTIVVVALAVALAGCGDDEPEAVEPETTATAGGAITVDPQAGAGEGEASEVPGDDLARRIQERLRTSSQLEDDTIVIQVEGGRVTLSGIVDSPTEVSMARDLIVDLPGVTHVSTDDLRVALQ